MTDVQLVRVNCPDLEVAREIATAAVEAECVACANIQGPIQSIYRWNDKIEQCEEWVLLLKTVVRHLQSLEDLVLERHPHEVPAILVISCNALHQPFGAWVELEVG